MGNQAEIGGGVLVAECGDGRGHHHQAGDGAAGDFGQLPVRTQGGIPAVFHQAHMDVHAGSGLAGRDLRSEGDVESPLVGEVPDDPFRQQELVGGRRHRIGQEFDLVLLIDLSVQGEVAHFAVSVFDLAAGLGDPDHAGAAEIVQLGEGLGFVVTLLVGGGEQGIGVGDDVILQLAHRLERHSGGLVESVLGPHQGLVGGAVEGLSVLVEETAQEAEGWNFVERIHESGPVPRKDVQVAVAGFDEGRKEAGTVYAFPFGQDGLGVGEIVDGEIQRLDAAVFGGVHEIDHPDSFFPDESEQIGTGELSGKLAQESHYLVRVEFNTVVHYQ